MELPQTGMVSPQLQQTYSAVMEDHPRSPSILSLEDWDMEDFDPETWDTEEIDPETWDVIVLSQEDLSDIFKDCDALPCPAYTHEGYQLREEEQQQYDHIKESREEDERIKQQELLQRHIPHVSPAALPTEWSLERELLEPLPDLDDCNSVEGSLSASTTSTCAAKSGEACGMVAASNASCTTSSTISASEDSDDNSVSSCLAPNDIPSGINIDQRTLKEVAGRHPALDCGQPSLYTSTSSQGASQEVCGHARSNLKPLADTSGSGAPILPFTFVPPFVPIVGSNAVTSMPFPPVPNIVDLACAANGWERVRNADIDTGSKETGKAQDGGQSRLLSSSSIRAKGQETGPNNRVKKRAKKKERLMKKRKAANRSRMKVAASNASYTTSSTISASEDSDDNSVSSCLAPNDIPSGINIDQRTLKEVAGRHPALDCGQPSLNTSTSSQGASQEVCGHASSNLKPLADTSGSGAPILPFTFVPPSVPIVGNNAVTSMPVPPAPNIVDLACAANGWERMRNADIDTGSKETGKAQDGGQSRLLSSSSIRAKGQETGPNNRVNEMAKKEERLMKNREAANRSRMKVAASNASCTTSSTISASEDSDDNSVSSCLAPNDIPSGINIDQRTLKEVAGRHPALDCGQPSLNTSTSSQGASQEVCGHASSNLKPLADTSGSGAPILPFTFVPPFVPIVGSNAVTSMPVPPAPNIVDLACAANGWERVRNADIDTGSKETGKAQDGGPSRLLSSSSIRAKGQETGPNNRVNEMAKKEERLMKNREAANRSRMKVAASNASCTTSSTISASEDSDDNSVSSCLAPNDIPSGINIDQRTLKEVAGRHPALDCGQPSLNTSTSSQGASQEVCGHASSNLKPLADTSGSGAPILPFTFVPPFVPIVGSNAVTSMPVPPAPNIVDLACAANGWERVRNADIDTGSKETGKAQDGGQSRLLSSFSIRAKGQETGPNNRVNEMAKKEERLMKNREAANRSRMKVAASNASCTTSSTISASEDSDDNSVSNCLAPNDIPSGINIDQWTLKEVAGRHPALDCGQPSLNTSTSSQGASQEVCGHASSNLNPLADTSGSGAPILLFTFVPPFVPIVGSNAVTSVPFPPVPNIVDLACAANGWERVRNADIDTGSKETGKAQDGGQSRLLSSSSIRAKGQETGPNNRVNERAKKEERLMKNREAANRSRMKRKEILSELENRTALLSNSLVVSREENDSRKQEMTSLREQKSFFRGMLSAKGVAHELPPLLPISSIRQSSGSNGGGGGSAVTAVNAVVGVIGTALALVSFVALSSTDYEGGGGSATNSTLGNMASSRGKSGSGRRMILSVDGYDLTSAHGHVEKEFNAGVRYVLGSEILALVVLTLLLFFVARKIYNLARRDANGRGRRMSVMSKAFPRKSRRSGSLVASREENDSLKQEMASLREQNSFLRGMFCAKGVAHELLPLLPISSIRQSNGSNGGGRGSATTVVNAVVGVMGTALALVRCVALSSTDYEGGGGSVTNPIFGNMASSCGKSGSGRKMILSVDDYDLTSAHGHATKEFNAGACYVLGSEILALVVPTLLLFFVAREIYSLARRDANGRGRRMSVMSRAFPRKSRRSGSWLTGFGVCKAQ